MKYYVVKSTKTIEGDLRAPAITAYDSKDLAEQAYFTACAEASTTGLGMYAVAELTENLSVVTGRTFLKDNIVEETDVLGEI